MSTKTRVVKKSAAKAVAETAAKAASKVRASKPATPRRSGFSKDKILAVATRMFAEYGFAAISIRDIAGACKISIPSIYHFFGDKENLYKSCCDEIFQGVSSQLHASLEHASPGRGRIKQFTAALCNILMHNHDFRRLLQRELLRDERRNIDKLTSHSFRAEFEMLTREIVALEGEEGAVDRTFSIYALTFGLLQLRRIGELAGTNKSVAGSSDLLAEYVLSIVLPGHSWSR